MHELLITMGWGFAILVFMILSGIYYWYPSYSKDSKKNLTATAEKIGELSRQISFWALALFLKWHFQLGLVTCAFLTVYMMFLSSYICYFIAKNRHNELSVVAKYDYNGYVRYILVAGVFWLVSILLYAAIISKTDWRQLSWLDYMNYSLLPWLTIVHELYPSKYLMRSRKVSWLLLLASLVDVALWCILNFK